MEVDLVVVVEQGEDVRLVGEVPMLPGCISQGRTIEELKVNMAEAVVGWLEVAGGKTAQQATQSGFSTFPIRFAFN